MIRKPTKAVLRNAILKLAESTKHVTADSCVVDGGALLHKVPWIPNSTYADVLEQYTTFVTNRYAKYGDVCVVFDGYTDVMSTKVAEQNRRMGSQSASIKIGKTVRVTCSREVFFRNTDNKEQLIKMLYSHLQEKGFHARKSDGDADTLIAKEALYRAKGRKSVVVATDDTDVLVLLMYHWKHDMEDVYFSTEKKEEKKAASPQFWKIRQLVEAQPHVKQLLFARAWIGCDTTSAIHKNG